MDDITADLRRADEIFDTAWQESQAPFTIFLERAYRRQLRWVDLGLASTRTGLDAGISLRYLGDRPVAVSLPLTRLRGAREERDLIRAASRSAWPGAPASRASRPAPRPAQRAASDLTAGLARCDPVSALGQLATAAHAGAKDACPRASVTVGYSDTYQSIVTAASPAHALTRDTRCRRRLIIQANASTAEGFPVTAFDAPGRSGLAPNWSADEAFELGLQVGQSLATRLTATPFPGGQVIAVLGPACAGLLAHETLGHHLEADSVLAGARFTADDIGTRIAAADVTVIDDPSRGDTWLRLGCDDEGTPPAPVTLLKEGRVAGFLTDARTSKRLNVPNSGHGRRQSYADDVWPRMTNTFVLAGSTAPQDLVADISYGIYITELDFGEVPASTGRFSLLATEAYLIEDGQIGSPVWGALLHGDSSVLGSVVGVGNDMQWRSAMCNKGGSWVPVAYGAPTIRLDETHIGGWEG